MYIIGCHIQNPLKSQDGKLNEIDGFFQGFSLDVLEKNLEDSLKMKARPPIAMSKKNTETTWECN